MPGTNRREKDGGSDSDREKERAFGQLVCLAAFDAILVRLLNSLAPTTWQVWSRPLACTVREGRGGVISV
jgi:hypothetical protein